MYMYIAGMGGGTFRLTMELGGGGAPIVCEQHSALPNHFVVQTFRRPWSLVMGTAMFKEKIF